MNRKTTGLPDVWETEKRSRDVAIRTTISGVCMISILICFLGYWVSVYFGWCS